MLDRIETADQKQRQCASDDTALNCGARVSKADGKGIAGTDSGSAPAATDTVGRSGQRPLLLAVRVKRLRHFNRVAGDGGPVTDVHLGANASGDIAL